MEHIELALKSGARIHARVQLPDKKPTSAILFLHGRGDSAANIIRLADNLRLESTLVMAPEAPGRTWYPERFLEPRSKNEPFLSEALETVEAAIAKIDTHFHIDAKRIVIAGFSQGACLCSEFVSRSGTHLAGACIMSGGLIGTDEEVAGMPRTELGNMPIYIGSDMEDFHIPLERVKETARILKEHGADVELRIYTELGHTVHPEAVDFLQRIVSSF